MNEKIHVRYESLNWIYVWRLREPKLKESLYIILSRKISKYFFDNFVGARWLDRTGILLMQQSKHIWKWRQKKRVFPWNIVWIFTQRTLLKRHINHNWVSIWKSFCREKCSLWVSHAVSGGMLEYTVEDQRCKNLI